MNGALISFLTSFCSTDALRPALRAPFTSPVSTGVVTVATNGHRLVALDEDYDCFPPPLRRSRTVS